MDDRTQENLKFLDTIDFIPYLNLHLKNVYELMNFIQVDFEVNSLPTFEEGFVFNCVSEDEFANYLKNRYPDIISRIIYASNDYYLQDDYCMIQYADDNIVAINNAEIGSYIKNHVVAVKDLGDDGVALIIPKDTSIVPWLKCQAKENQKNYFKLKKYLEKENLEDALAEQKIKEKEERKKRRAEKKLEKEKLDKSFPSDFNDLEAFGFRD